MDATPPPALVGRAREREAIAAVLAAPAGVLVIEGEPGIGKSRLLDHLATQAAAGGATVLAARATEYEADLPYGLFTEALDEHLTALDDGRQARLGLSDPAALVAMLPALAEVAGEPAPADRHRSHRALRDLLERLAAARPVVLCLDDVHWADPASCGALAALVRRPPAARVLLGLAARAGRVPAPLAAALAEDRVTRLALGPLTRAEAAQLVGDAAGELYADSGGNPFYLEQLARGRAGQDNRGGAGDGSVPHAVAAALAAELAGLPRAARRLLDAAAVAGDPFEPGLAAEVAELSEPEGLDALDELLARGVVRPAGAPRRFAFRHPVVRHAVYDATPGGWRLGAHGRAADVLERRRAGPIARAHHVEHAARPGDEEAIAVLGAAARELQSPAPATAAHFYAATLRLLPETGRERHTELRLRLVDALAAAGDAAGARETVLEALRTAGPAERLPLTVALANQEWWLGGHEDARRRLHVALGDVPARPSPDRIRLRLALALTALLACDLADAQFHARDARDDARAIEDPAFELAALACTALARVSAADGAAGLDESSAALERLTPDQLATRLPALWMHARARRGLGHLDASLADLERAAAIAADTGRERVLLMVTIESVPTLIELGRLAEAAAAADDGVERARVTGNPRMLLWASSALACARLAAGDVGAALKHAGEAAGAGTRADFLAVGQPGWCLGAALTAGGNADRAATVLLAAFGGPELQALPPADRPAAAGDLVEAQLARGDLAAAEAALAPGRAAAERAGTAWAAALCGIADSAVLLARDRAADAAAVASAARAAAAGAPLASARARLAEGRALAAAGDRSAAVAALAEAEAALHAYGATRLRSAAARELRRLGHRVQRPATSHSGTLAVLTAREREIAELVAAGRTNQEIAAQLVLSTRTVEAHLRNAYGKLGVRSRVELTRDLQSER